MTAPPQTFAKLFLWDTKRHPPTLASEVASETLDRAESARLLTIKNSEVRSSYLWSHWFWRTCLSRYFDTSKAPHDWEFEPRVHGQPALKNAPKLFTSLSRSGSLILCGISPDGNIGVDLEVHQESFNQRDVLENFFSSEEKTWIQSQKNIQAAFYTLWTLKEAHSKAAGVGLSKDWTGFDFAGSVGQWLKPGTALQDQRISAWSSSLSSPEASCSAVLLIPGVGFQLQQFIP